METEQKHIIGIVQARMRSTRLPGKVLRPLPVEGGKPVLFHVLSRLAKCKEVTRWILATSTLPDDDVIEQFGKDFGIGVFRGDEQDCVKRFYDAAVSQSCTKGSYVVRITSDNPCTDWNYIDAAIAEAVRGQFDLYGLWDSAPRHEEFPNGLDNEVMSFHALEQVCLNAKFEHERQHVIPYIYDHPTEFRIGVLERAELQGTADCNWTLDTPDDYKFLDAVYQELYSPDKFFVTSDILDLLKRKPELSQISPAKPAWKQNAGTYKTLCEKLKEVSQERTGTINFSATDEECSKDERYTFHCKRLLRSMSIGLQGLLQELGWQSDVKVDVQSDRVVLASTSEDANFWGAFLQEMKARGVEFDGQLIPSSKLRQVDVALLLETLRSVAEVCKPKPSA